MLKVSFEGGRQRTLIKVFLKASRQHNKCPCVQRFMNWEGGHFSAAL